MIIVNCPRCKKTVEWTKKNVFKPFCSERCKFVDLDEWFNEEKRIAGDEIADDLLLNDVEN